MPDISNCPTCGTKLPVNALMSLCVPCLLKAGLREESAAPAPSPDFSTVIGPYKLLEKVGEGGMGEVWMAEQSEPIRRKVALKIIKAGLDSKQVLARFEAERQALALMDHPNIARVLDAGSTPDGRPYFAMELVKGVPLTKFCDDQRLSIRERLELFMPVCQAIQHAHQKGIIHRDIKPTNVLVALYDGKPVPKVIDFGIAKATGQQLTEKTLFTNFGAVVGTLEYMSPEQAELNQLDIDTRSDIYSLGVLLYELLTGTTPLTRETLKQAAFDEVLRRIRTEEPPRPSTRLSESRERLSDISAQRKLEPVQLVNLIRTDLDWIAIKALEKDRNRRYESTTSLATDIHRYLADAPVVARPPSNLYRFQKLVRRNKLAFTAAGVVAGVVIFGIIATSWQALRAARAEREQRRLLQQADSAGGQARDQSKRAEIALSAARFQQAMRLMSDDNGTAALAYLSASISANPTNDLAARQLALLLNERAWRPEIDLEHAGPVSLGEFSPDGNRLVTSSSNKVRVWAAKTGVPVTPWLLHESSVLSAEFNNNGTLLLTATTNNARVWALPSGQLVLGPTPHDSSIEPAFRADGRMIFTANTNHLQIWNIQSGAVSAGPWKHPSRIAAAQFSPDGQRIATAASNTLYLWDIKSGNLAVPPMVHENAVDSVQFSPDPDGGFLLTTTGTNALCLWDSRKGSLVAQQSPIPGLGLARFPIRDTSRIKPAQFSPDGTRVISVCQEDMRSVGARGRVRVWAFHNGFLETNTLIHSNFVAYAKFTSDGKHVLTSSGLWRARWDTTQVEWWDAQTGLRAAPAWKFRHSVQMVEMSADGGRALACLDDHSFRLWRPGIQEPVMQTLKHDDGATRSRFAPDGARLLTFSQDQIARVWVEPSSGLKHSRHVTSANFSPNGELIVTTSDDHNVVVWDSPTRLPLTSGLAHEAPPSISFHANGRVILTTTTNCARLWDVHSGRLISGPWKHPLGFSGASLSRDGTRIVKISNQRGRKDAFALLPSYQETRRSIMRTRTRSPQPGQVLIWDVLKGEQVGNVLTHDMGAKFVEFGSTEKRIVAVDCDGVRLWDAENGRLIAGPLENTEQVVLTRIGPSQRVLATIDAHSIRVWDMRDGRLLAGPLHQAGLVINVNFSPDGGKLLAEERLGLNWLGTNAASEIVYETDASTKQLRYWDAVAGTDLTAIISSNSMSEFRMLSNRVVQLWDIETGREITGPIRSETRVRAFEFTSDGRRLITATGGEVRLWDSETGKLERLLFRHGRFITSLRFLADDSRIATISGAEFDSYSACLWDANTGRQVGGSWPNEESKRRVIRVSPDGRRFLPILSDMPRVCDARTAESLSEPILPRNWNFSADWRRILTWEGDTVLIHEIPPFQMPCPKWLPELAEAVAGVRLSNGGTLEPTPRKRAEIVQRIRRELKESSDQGEWTVWGRRYFGDSTARPASAIPKNTPAEN